MGGGPPFRPPLGSALSLPSPLAFSLLHPTAFLRHPPSQVHPRRKKPSSLSLLMHSFNPNIALFGSPASPAQIPVSGTPVHSHVPFNHSYTPFPQTPHPNSFSWHPPQQLSSFPPASVRLLRVFLCFPFNSDPPGCPAIQFPSCPPIITLFSWLSRPTFNNDFHSLNKCLLSRCRVPRRA